LASVFYKLRARIEAFGINIANGNNLYALLSNNPAEVCLAHTEEANASNLQAIARRNRSVFTECRCRDDRRESECESGKGCTLYKITTGQGGVCHNAITMPLAFCSKELRLQFEVK
jgi:hypothetical protein